MAHIQHFPCNWRSNPIQQSPNRQVHANSKDASLALLQSFQHPVCCPNTTVLPINTVFQSTIITLDQWSSGDACGMPYALCCALTARDIQNPSPNPASHPPFLPAGNHPQPCKQQCCTTNSPPGTRAAADSIHSRLRCQDQQHVQHCTEDSVQRPTLTRLGAAPSARGPCPVLANFLHTFALSQGHYTTLPSTENTCSNSTRAHKSTSQAATLGACCLGQLAAH